MSGTPDLPELAALFKRAVEDALIATADDPAFDTFGKGLSKAEDRELLELEGDDLFYKAWMFAINMAREKKVPPAIQTRLAELEATKEDRLIRLADLYAAAIATVPGADDLLYARTFDRAADVSEGFAAKGAQHLARFYAPRR